MIAAISHAVRAARRRQEGAENGVLDAAQAGTPRWHLDMTPEQWAEVDKFVAGRTMPQRVVAHFYNAPATQLTVAVLIFANFVVSTVQAQMLPSEGSAATHVFTQLEWVFNMVFLVELVVNMFGHWFWLFWGSAWNWFDFIIVAVSLIALLLPNLPGIQVLEVEVEVVQTRGTRNPLIGPSSPQGSEDTLAPQTAQRDDLRLCLYSPYGNEADKQCG